MLLNSIVITDDDVAFAESLLFNGEKIYTIDGNDSSLIREQKQERLNFIKSLETLDLDAVPGSGKTTALLMKLVILEQKLPLVDGSGVAVLSHTNAAVDEIRLKIGYLCPKLFGYPNFIGTIQNFVNKFLAIPYLKGSVKKSRIRVDTDVYKARVNLSKASLSYAARKFLERSYQNLDELCFDADLNLCKKNGSIFLDKLKNPLVYKSISDVKSDAVKDGFINYEEAYIFAERYLFRYPNVLNLIRGRFKFVFLDEMQDIDQKQHNLLDRLFFGEGNFYQRLGDNNQAIYNGDQVLFSKRDRNLVFSCSHRLSPGNSALVSRFQCNGDLNIQGLYDSKILPHLLVFNDNNIENVVSVYYDLLFKYNEMGFLKNINKLPCCVVSWIVDKEISSNDYSKLSMKHFYPNLDRKHKENKFKFEFLVDYFYYVNDKSYFHDLYNSLIDAVLFVLRLEGHKSAAGVFFNKKSMLDYLKEKGFFDEFNKKLYEIILLCINDGRAEAVDGFKVFLKGIFCGVLGFSFSSKSQSFFDQPASLPLINNVPSSSIELKFDTVHSVKGQTHCSTLYLESYFSGDYDTGRLHELLSGKKSYFSQLSNSNKPRHIQSCKLMYVGLSRATDFLAIAIHQNRFDMYLKNKINETEWIVIDL